MTVAVIGHGRSPEGRRWGGRVDACRTVVRMWDWHWQVDGPDDWGTRYDYGVIELLPRITEVFWERNRVQPAESWLAYWRQPPTAPVPDNTIVIGQTWRDEAWALGGRGAGGNVLNLTRGCAAACWAIMRHAHEGEDVVLVGFDNAFAGHCLPTDDAFPERYLEQYDRQYPHWRRNWYTPGLTTCGTHDIAIERPLMARLAERAGVDLRFAQEAWP